MNYPLLERSLLLDKKNCIVFSGYGMKTVELYGFSGSYSLKKWNYVVFPGVIVKKWRYVVISGKKLSNSVFYDHPFFFIVIHRIDIRHQLLKIKKKIDHLFRQLLQLILFRQLEMVFLFS